jgi:hypothetical protein
MKRKLKPAKEMCHVTSKGKHVRVKVLNRKLKKKEGKK